MKIIIVSPKKALKVASKIAGDNYDIHCLVSDYEYIAGLQRSLADRVAVYTLGSLFEQTFNEIKGGLLNAMGELAACHSDFDWWGHQFPSKNTTSTDWAKNIVYLFCAGKIMGNLNADKVFIVDSPALARSIEKTALRSGHKVVNHFGAVDELLRRLRDNVQRGIKTVYFFTCSLNRAWWASLILKKTISKRAPGKKVVILRSWVTNGVFDEAGRFHDRNFGILPDWLNKKGHEVWTMPMFFNFSMKSRNFYLLLKKHGHKFLIPELYLKFNDYWRVFYGTCLIMRKRLNNIKIEGTDVSSITNEAIKKHGFSPQLMMLNLCAPLLKRLKDEEFEVDRFYYPYEGNAPEKQFILGCRQYFPRAAVIGFQHTVFCPNQLAYFMDQKEKRYHPLPDKIICSGPIYLDLYKSAGISPAMLEAGANLRFQSINPGILRFPQSKSRSLLIVTTFSYEQDFDMLAKLARALKGSIDYRIFLRIHPLLSQKRVVDFLTGVGIKNFEFANGGSVQDWLAKTDIMFSSGASVTILEAVLMGIPVIRVVPDNTFFYDPFTWLEYPIKPAFGASDIVKNIEYIDKVRYNNGMVFSDTAVKVNREYFTQTSEESLKAFNVT